MKNKIIVSVFGSPGSGKGTQADRIAERYNLDHIDTGNLIERTVHDSSLQSDPIVVRERENFDTGKLCTPEWIVTVLESVIRKHHARGRGIVFSGSPRTLHEAEALLPVFADLYGSDAIFFVHIIVRPETAIFRNIHRRICSKCGRSVMYSSETSSNAFCSHCNGEIITRTLDNADAMRIRLEEYEKRTMPIFDFMRGCGFSIIDIDGEPNPDIVTKEIFEKIPLS
jgi:adenylate kinase